MEKRKKYNFSSYSKWMLVSCVIKSFVISTWGVLWRADRLLYEYGNWVCVGATINFFFFHVSARQESKALELCVEGERAKRLFICINGANRQFEFMKMIRDDFRFCIFMAAVSISTAIPANWRRWSRRIQASMRHVEYLSRLSHDILTLTTVLNLSTLTS